MELEKSPIPFRVADGEAHGCPQGQIEESPRDKVFALTAILGAISGAILGSLLSRRYVDARSYPDMGTLGTMIGCLGFCAAWALLSRITVVLAKIRLAASTVICSVTGAIGWLAISIALAVTEHGNTFVFVGLLFGSGLFAVPSTYALVRDICSYSGH